MLANLITKFETVADKVSKVNKSRWGVLSTGEKILKVMLYAVKIGLILCFAAIMFVIGLGIWIAFGIMSGITGAVNGQINRSYNDRHKGYW